MCLGKPLRRLVRLDGSHGELRPAHNQTAFPERSSAHSTTESKGKIIYNILWGFGKKKLTQKASLLVEDNGLAGSVVHLNLLVAQTKARGIFGTSFSDGQMVKLADPYEQFFTALDYEVKDRALRYVPVPAAAPAQAAVAGATSGTQN